MRLGQAAASFSWDYPKAFMQTSTSPQIWASSLSRLAQWWVQGMHKATACLALHPSLGGESQPPTILFRSRHWAQQALLLTHSPRVTEKLKPRFVFISEAQYRKRSFLSENIKELGLLCQDFYFKTARLILYTYLYLSISFGNLICKEMIFRKRKKTHAFELATGMKLYFILTHATLAIHWFPTKKILCIFV